jgi:rhodanese-related sulfurtransferase
MSNQEPNDMDGSSFAMPGDDAWLESLLREDARRQPHIADDGFASRVMNRIPPPAKAAPRWLVPAAGMVGSAAAVGLTPAGAWFVHNLVGLLDIRHFSLAHLSVLVPIALFYVCSFAATRDR